VANAFLLFRRCLRLGYCASVFLVALFSFPVNVLADVAPTSTWSMVGSGYSVTGQSTASAACSAWWAAIPNTASPKVYGWQTLVGAAGANLTIDTGARFGQCQARCTDQTLCGAQYNVAGSSGTLQEVFGACPTGSTLSGRMCVSNGTSCTDPVGTKEYSGYFDIGTAPGGSPPSTVCKNHCVAAFYGTSPSATTMVDGVRHYYAKGDYDVDQTGPAGYCAVDTNIVDVKQSNSAPAPSCPAGQSVGYVNGVSMCYPSPSTPPVTPPVTTTQQPTTTTSNPDGSTTTSSTVNHPDGSSTTTATTCQGASCSTTITENPAPDPVAQKSFCDAHPTDPSCLKSQPSTVPGQPSSLYTPTGKTFTGVLTSFVDTMKTKPFYAASTGFFNVNVGGGSCPTWSTHVWVFQVTIDQQCSTAMENIWPFISAMIMLCASFLAFRWAFL